MMPVTLISPTLASAPSRKFKEPPIPSVPPEETVAVGPSIVRLSAIVVFGIRLRVPLVTFRLALVMVGILKLVSPVISNILPALELNCDAVCVPPVNVTAAPAPERIFIVPVPALMSFPIVVPAEELFVFRAMLPLLVLILPLILISPAGSGDGAARSAADNVRVAPLMFRSPSIVILRPA